MDSAYPANLLHYVERTRQYMHEHYRQPIDVEALARASGTSSNRFYQAFKKQTGLTPNKYVTALRLNAALPLLARPQASVKDAAHEIGYEDEFYFSRLFKKQMGMSPSEYMIHAGKRVANLSPVFRGDLEVLGIKPVLSFERGWSAQPDSNLKLIEQSKPDIIFTSPVSEDVYRALTGIAPVVLLYWKRLGWKERFLQISEKLGLTSVAERWLSIFDMKQENALFYIRNRLGDEPFLVITVLEEHYRILSKLDGGTGDLFFGSNRFASSAPAGTFSFLDVADLNEVMSLGCKNFLFFMNSSISNERSFRLKEEWQSLKEREKELQCLCIRHSERMLYNAAVHEVVLDQTVKQLASVI